MRPTIWLPGVLSLASALAQEPSPRPQGTATSTIREQTIREQLHSAVRRMIDGPVQLVEHRSSRALRNGDTIYCENDLPEEWKMFAQSVAEHYRI